MTQYQLEENTNLLLLSIQINELAKKGFKLLGPVQAYQTTGAPFRSYIATPVWEVDK